jgi:hypothetical protein
MASRLHGVRDLADIGDAVARRSEKMKDSAVVPQIVSRAPQFDFSDVSDEPMDTIRGFPQSFPVRIDGGLRSIEDGNLLVSTGEKVINQRRFTPAHVDDGLRATSSRLFYKRKRRFKVRTVPTDCVRSFFSVDVFLMSLYIHIDQRPHVLIDSS